MNSILDNSRIKGEMWTGSDSVAWEGGCGHLTSGKMR